MIVLEILFLLIGALLLLTGLAVWALLLGWIHDHRKSQKEAQKCPKSRKKSTRHPPRSAGSE
jgi:uncharacterized membrane protein